MAPPHKGKLRLYSGYLKESLSAAVRINYAERIRSRVRPNILPNEQVAPNLVAVVQLNLAPDGSLLSSHLIKPSGSATWDAAVLRAVERSVPYPAADNGTVPASFTITFRPQ
jgi:colicin import membrane protein